MSAVRRCYPRAPSLAATRDRTETLSDERDVDLVTSQLGREPAGAFEVVVRAEDGSPAVIANSPFLFDGTPMPTRYWLTDADAARGGEPARVGRWRACGRARGRR